MMSENTSSSKVKTEIPNGMEDIEKPLNSKPAKAGSNKAIAIFAFLVLVGVAVVVGVVPDWGGKDSNKQQLNNYNGTPETAYYTSSNGPYNVSIPLFSANITSGYASRDDLVHDLEELAKYLLNDAITSNADSSNRYYYGDEEAEDAGYDAPEADGDTAATADDSGSEGVSDATDFETNNQEENVDRADMIKSDGSFVFAAFTDYLLVWPVGGDEVIAKIQMPPVNYSNIFYYEGEIREEPEEPIEEKDDSSTTSSGGTTDGDASAGSDSGSDSGVDEPMVDTDYYYWTPRPYINAILVEDGRLTVVVSGYSYYSYGTGESTVLGDYQGTNIRVYDINGGDPQLVGSTFVNGYYRNAYSVGDSMYVVTQSWLNTWEHLLAPIQRWQPEFEGLTDEEYVAAVTAMADEGLIEAFVDKLIEELEVNGEVDLARLSVFADSLSGDNLEDSLYSGNIANAVTQITSFDIGSDNGMTLDEFPLQISATFHPGSWGQVYATEGMIIVADQSWSWIPETGESGQKTFLLGFRLDGPSSSHALVGSVDGYPLNEYSIDFYENESGSYVRIATSQSFWSMWMIDDVAVDGDMVVDTDVAEPAATETETETESSTINQIIVLRIPDLENEDGDKVLEQVGSVELGEPNELFTAVRFFDSFAYAVTYERTDPFYVIDLTEEEPEVTGELKVSGFSEYLHPIDSNNQMLVAVGQETDDAGIVIGLQVSVFDATDPSSPSLVDRYVVENDENAWSSSTVSWDTRAFRFLKLGESTGKLIIPVSVYSWRDSKDNFEGFSVFDIQSGMITGSFNIDHGTDYGYSYQCGYYYGSLPQRSFVFSGDVMTTMGGTVISTDLSTGKEEWRMSLSDVDFGCRK